MIDTNHKIEFNPESCIGCQICYKACFVDVIRWDEENRRPVFQYVEDCEHCEYCEAKCPKGCIRVIPDYSSQSFRQTFNRYSKGSRELWED
ncbi:MAG: 4Fe-4S dicluster domain-containing protein [Eubacterium sp.]|jgi:formate hydrogenlyase subunit 6/NADH:ubiquinone oxidoreductase subunit I|nr:4Fe-4S binding protein [Lachnospiraceae bacterium]HAD19758.1 4Fe-4S ferredoxin [Lachnospiraceae bacterium]